MFKSITSMFSTFPFSVISALHNKNPTNVLSSTETKDGVDYVADRATDADIYTCATSGFQKGAWFKTKLNNIQRITDISVRGNSHLYVHLTTLLKSFGFKLTFSTHNQFLTVFKANRLLPHDYPHTSNNCRQTFWAGNDCSAVKGWTD